MARHARGGSVGGAVTSGQGPGSGLVLGRRSAVLALLLGTALVGVSLVWRLAEGAGWRPTSLQLDRILDVDEDLSVLNWLSASVFLLAGLLLAQCAAARSGGSRWWWGLLAGGVVFVSLDEAAGAHDPVRVAVEATLRGGGGPAAVVVVVALLALPVGAGVLRALPRRLRWRALLAVVLVVLAAVGVDSLGPDLTDAPERRLETWYVLTSSVEELVELLAACLLLDVAVTASTVPATIDLRREDAPAEPVEQHQAQPR